MNDLLGPPLTSAGYQAHVKAFSGLLSKVPFDDRRDLLNEALARACARWDPARSPWKPWILLVLQGAIRDFCRDFRAGHSPLSEDLPGPDESPRIFSKLELGQLFTHLNVRQRQAITAGKGGQTAHRARLRLRQIATQSPQQPRSYSDVY